MGLRWVRLHCLEIDDDNVRRELALSEPENIHALLQLATLESELKSLKFDVFSDVRDMLRGKDSHVGCTIRGCDPYATQAVKGIEGNGQRSNCGRTNKDGIDFVKADAQGYERYIALYLVPQEYGGCNGCRFFLICKGECPGSAIDNDWRNRSEHCNVWRTIYEYFEKQMVLNGDTPLSIHPLREDLESRLVSRWEEGENINIEDLLKTLDNPNHATENKDNTDKEDKDTDSRKKKPKREPEHKDYKDAPFNDGHRDTPEHSDYSHGDGWLGAT